MNAREYRCDNKTITSEKLTLECGRPAIKLISNGREKLLVYRESYDDARDFDFENIDSKTAQALMSQLGPDLSLLRQIRIPGI